MNPCELDFPRLLGCATAPFTKAARSKQRGHKRGNCGKEVVRSAGAQHMDLRMHETMRLQLVGLLSFHTAGFRNFQVSHECQLTPSPTGHRRQVNGCRPPIKAAVKP